MLTFGEKIENKKMVFLAKLLVVIEKDVLELA